MLLHELTFIFIVFNVIFFPTFIFFAFIVQFSSSKPTFNSPPLLCPTLSSTPQLFFIAPFFNFQLSLKLILFIFLFEFLSFQVKQAYYSRFLLELIGLFSLFQVLIFLIRLFLLIKVFIFPFLQFTVAF
jgi:hypothetical protein